MSEAAVNDPHTVQKTTTITVEARDLDTDERSRTVLEGAAPRAPAQQRAELIAEVTRLHPTARIRSFASGVATFLDRQHLVVAWYERLPRGRRTEEAEQAPPQESLFAA
ncbi:MAG: hypothetical protein ACR2LH_00840 [Thermoleophilaceae bacterium]